MTNRARAWIIAGLLTAAAATLLAGVAGCSSAQEPEDRAARSMTRERRTEPPVESFDALPVVQVLTPWGSAGSAIRLDDRHLLTARHVLPRRVNEIEVLGKSRAFERVASGEGAGGRGPAHDWALIRLSEPLPTVDPRRGAMEPFASLGSSSRLREGTRVYLVGYWRGESRWPSRERLRQLDTSVIPARAVDMADTPEFPRDSLFFAVTDAGAVFPGASGGAAVVWNEQDQRLKIVGIYVGAGEYTRLDVVPNTPDGGRAQIIRRIPDVAYDLARPAAVSTPQGATSATTPDPTVQ